MVPQKVICVDVDGLDNATQSQGDDAPVMSRSSAPPRLPSVHPFAAIGVLIRDENSATGLEQIFLLREEFIVREQGLSANALGREVNQAWWHRILRIHRDASRKGRHGRQ